MNEQEQVLLVAALNRLTDEMVRMVQVVGDLQNRVIEIERRLDQREDYEREQRDR